MALAGAWVDNRQIRVDYAKPKPPRGSPGSGGGGYSPRGRGGGGKGVAAAGAAGGRGGGRGKGASPRGGSTLKRGSGAIATSTGKKTTFD